MLICPSYFSSHSKHALVVRILNKKGNMVSYILVNNIANKKSNYGNNSKNQNHT